MRKNEENLSGMFLFAGVNMHMTITQQMLCVVVPPASRTQMHHLIGFNLQHCIARVGKARGECEATRAC